MNEHDFHPFESAEARDKWLTYCIKLVDKLWLASFFGPVASVDPGDALDALIHRFQTFARNYTPRNAYALSYSICQYVARDMKRKQAKLRLTHLQHEELDRLVAYEHALDLERSEFPERLLELLTPDQRRFISLVREHRWHLDDPDDISAALQAANLTPAAYRTMMSRIKMRLAPHFQIFHEDLKKCFYAEFMRVPADWPYAPDWLVNLISFAARIDLVILPAKDAPTTEEAASIFPDTLRPGRDP